MPYKGWTELDEAKVTILFSDYGMRIELLDDKANVRFAVIELNPDQVSQAFGRLANTPCKISIPPKEAMDRLNLTMEHKELIFEIPEDLRWYRNKEENRAKLLLLMEKATPEGWIASSYFGSQGSFFKKDDKHYARTTIRRWV